MKIDGTQSNLGGDIAAIAGPIVGLAGLCYGFMKDRALKQITKRADSPFFTAPMMLLSARTENRPDGKRPFFSYNREPQELSHGPFFVRDISVLPEDYPDGHPAGLVLQNTGSELRSFKVTSRERLVLRETGREDNQYELWYVFSKASQGTTFTFSITFESAAGIQGKQVWEVTKGARIVRRLKPRTPHAVWDRLPFKAFRVHRCSPSK